MKEEKWTRRRPIEGVWKLETSIVADFYLPLYEKYSLEYLIK